MKDDPEEVIVDEEGNIEVETIERVKPVLEALEDEGAAEDDEDEDDDSDDEEVEDESDEEYADDEA
jgi:DNA gyrase subunit A